MIIFVKRMLVLFYVTMTLFLGSFIILLASHWVTVNDLVRLLRVPYEPEKMRMVLLIAGISLVVLNFIFYSVFSINVHRDKIIAFDNATGRVTVSLMAVEDLIRRQITFLPDIRDVKSNITASKKGLHIWMKLILRSDVNIPDITSRVQKMVVRKIQDTIGITNPIEVEIYVGKILFDRSKAKENAKEAQTPLEPQRIPFHGYRA